jgi:hypothetical protein
MEHEYWLVDDMGWLGWMKVTAGQQREGYMHARPVRGKIERILVPPPPPKRQLKIYYK